MLDAPTLETWLWDAARQIRGPLDAPIGSPSSPSADWGWEQHMLASLAIGAWMAVVLDTGAVSRGSGNAGSNRERTIRKAFIEGPPAAADARLGGDLIEAVVLLREAEEEREAADRELDWVLRELRLGGLRSV